MARPQPPPAAAARPPATDPLPLASQPTASRRRFAPRRRPPARGLRQEPPRRPFDKPVSYIISTLSSRSHTDLVKPAQHSVFKDQRQQPRGFNIQGLHIIRSFLVSHSELDDFFESESEDDDAAASPSRASSSSSHNTAAKSGASTRSAAMRRTCGCNKTSS